MALFSQVGKYSNFGLFIMRAGIGAILIMYGLPKLTHPEKWAGLGEAMGNLHIHFLYSFWGFMSALTLTVGGLFCILGLWFRLVSLLLLFNFIVATLVHLYGSGSLNERLNDGAHAMELCFVFAGFFFVGAGKFSVDRS